MLKPKDAEGKIPLTGSEYDELRHIIIAFNELHSRIGAMKERLQTLPMGWCNARMIDVRMEKLVDQILSTVPTKKLQAFRDELRNSKIVLTVGWDAKKDDCTAYLPEKSLIALLDMLIRRDCWDCELKGKAAKKCPIRTTYLDCLHYEADREPADGSCEMAGMNSIYDNIVS